MSEILDSVTPRHSAVVMASAGTGKTWLLVTRLIRLLLEGARPDAILAVTFTRKAAAEMLSRLNERVREFAGMSDDELRQALNYIDAASDPHTLQLARNLYERLLFSSHTLRATTFHAFCQELLQRFPLEADIPPGFELLEYSGMLEQEAWEALFDEATRAPDGELARALELLLDRCGGLHNSHSALMTLLRRRNDWWAYTEGCEQLPREATRRLRQLLEIDPAVDYYAEFFSAARQPELEEFSQLLRKNSTATNKKQAGELQQLLAQQERGEATFRAVARVFLTASNSPRVRKASQAQQKRMGAADEQRFLQLHETLSQALLESLDRLARQHTLIASQAWFTAGNRLIEHYQRLKAEQRCLDFNDLEWKTYQLLNRSDNAHWVQYKLDQRVDHFLIDEFQDTNPTQWRLLLPLLEEISAADHDRQRSAFLVGDAKQSIYRFRRADAGLLHSAADWLEQHLQSGIYTMDHSRRSAPAIIHCVNQVFSSPELQQRLQGFNPHHTHLDGLWGRVELLPLATTGSAAEEDPDDDEPAALRNPLTTPRRLQENLAPLREGRQIAATIERMIRERWPVTHGDQTRPMSYSDIFILLRTRGKAEQIEQALRDAAIPYTGAERGTLLQSLEIQDMEALLTILVTPYNNLALAQVLKSPLFDVSDGELVTLATTTATGPWIERLLTAAAGANSPASLQRAANYLARWRDYAGKVPVHDLLDRIYSEGDVVGRYESAFPVSLRPRVRSNLTRFLELALEIDAGRYPSMTLFLARLRALRNSPVDAPDQPPSGDNLDRVQLLTIHASKGLEAPVVFIADSASTQQPKSSYEAIVEWPTAAPAPHCFLLTGKKEQQDSVSRAILAREREQQLTEDANLLYVALTRARQYLYLSGNRGERNSSPGWYDLVAAQLAQTAEPDDHGGLVLEVGTPPPPATSPAAPAPVPREAIDPRLGQPMVTPTTAAAEIAPSQIATAPGGGAGAVDEDGLTRGIAIHRILELLSSGQETERRQILRQLAYELAMTTDEPQLQEWYAEAHGVINAPHLAGYFEPRHYREAMNEVPILYGRDGITINGIADRLIICPDKVVILDYKTHRHASPDNLAQLAEAYREQMGMYAEGIRRQWQGVEIRQVLLFTACREAYALDAG